jgi:RimJ/RimL family protein N-acetyltransferase
VWRADGGVVSCADAAIGNRLCEALSVFPNPTAVDSDHRIANSFAAVGLHPKVLIDHSLLWRASAAFPSLSSAEEVDLVDKDATELGKTLPAEVEHVFVLRKGDSIACWASNIPVLQVGDHWIHSLEVETKAPYRRQGLARRVVGAALAHFKDENGTALWVCKSYNIPSLRLAESLGFVHHFSILHWRFEDEPAPRQ